MLIPCEECKKDISSKAVYCPNCGHPVDSQRAQAIASSAADSKRFRLKFWPFWLCLFLVGILIFSDDPTPDPSLSAPEERVEETSAPDARAPERVENFAPAPDAVPFSKTWQIIAPTFGLNPELAQSMAQKVRAEDHRCEEIENYQTSGEGGYTLLCGGSYVYELAGRDGAWITVTPDKHNPDQTDTRSVEEKAEAAGEFESARETPKGRKYRITREALHSFQDKRGISRAVDLMVDFVRDKNKECARVILVFLDLNANSMSITCAEEFKPSKDYYFHLTGDTLIFNQSISD